jgi:hypothetical protein
MSAIPGAFGKRFKCPCCNNPWNQTDEGSIGTIFCDPCLADDKGYQGIDPKNFDHAESPKVKVLLYSAAALAVLYSVLCLAAPGCVVLRYVSSKCFAVMS